MVRRGFIGLFAAGVAAAVMAACGGAGFNGPSATLRFVNATSAYASLDFVVAGQTVAGATAFGQGSAYVGVDPDRAATTVRAAGASTALTSLTPALTRSRAHTLVAYGGESAVKTLLVEDEEAADATQAKLRVIHAAPDAGALDVFVTAAGDPLATATALHSAVAAGKASSYATRGAGTWQVTVTGAGDRDDPRLRLTDVVLSAGQVATLLLTPTTGGAMVGAAWMVDKGAVSLLPVNQARVRLAAPQAGQVSLQVGNTVVSAPVGAPLLGGYQVVNAGQQAVSATWQGSLLALPAVTLAPGTDQTLLVNPSLAPSGHWVLDDNRAPTAEGKARVRLLHGLAGQTAPLQMQVDLLPVASDIAPPAASGYSVVDAGSRRITVRVGASGTALLDLPGQTLDAGRVYTVFPVEGTPPAAGIIRRDR